MAAATYTHPKYFVDVESETHSSSGSSMRTSRSTIMNRKIVHMWKVVTRLTRKKERISFVPPDFVLVTKRKSILMR
ncbi:hypothetical protein H0H92_010707 [Tricholoma furcatifolium]|nr:hypothetical protein H0H92_010707 [Tricholoma furcatifolium]